MEKNEIISIDGIFANAGLKAAIFDLDGTLLDTMEIWNELGARYLVSLGITPKEGLCEVLYPMTLEESCAYLKRHCIPDFSEENIYRGIMRLLGRFYREEAPLKKGADRLLGTLSRLGIPMAAATSGDRELAEAALKRLGILGCFRAVLTCSELETSKHEPKIYHAAAELLGTLPHETAVFEDALYAAETAAEAGFFTFGVYDRSAEADADRLKKICGVYLGAEYSADEKL